MQRSTLANRIACFMPRWLVYWCAVRLIAYATTGKYSDTVVPELTAMDALARWTSQQTPVEREGGTFLVQHLMDLNTWW